MEVSGKYLKRETIRNPANYFYRIKEGERVIEVIEQELYRQKKVMGCIRIVDAEYSGIDRSLQYYAHFNLEQSGHIVGSRYALPRILEHGYFRTPEDQQGPILSFHDVLAGVCVAVRERIPYEELSESDFLYSMKHIKNTPELQQAILSRYHVSVPDVEPDELLRHGVGITLLQLDGVVD